jgi:hypothetical protein
VKNNTSTKIKLNTGVGRQTLSWGCIQTDFQALGHTLLQALHQHPPSSPHLLEVRWHTVDGQSGPALSSLRIPWSLGQILELVPHQGYRLKTRLATDAERPLAPTEGWVVYWVTSRRQNMTNLNDLAHSYL